MKVIKYLLEKEIVVDNKDFEDLYSIRAIKIDNEYLTDPNMDMTNIKKIQVGYSTIIEVE